jgi:hypothetical protein
VKIIKLTQCINLETRGPFILINEIGEAWFDFLPSYQPTVYNLFGKRYRSIMLTSDRVSVCIPSGASVVIPPDKDEVMRWVF